MSGHSCENCSSCSRVEIIHNSMILPFFNQKLQAIEKLKQQQASGKELEKNQVCLLDYEI